MNSAVNNLSGRNNNNTIMFERNTNYANINNNTSFHDKEIRPKPKVDCNRVLIIKPIYLDQLSEDLLKNSKKRIEMLKNSMFKECIEKEMIIEIRVNLKKRHLVVMLTDDCEMNLLRELEKVNKLGNCEIECRTPHNFNIHKMVVLNYDVELNEIEVENELLGCGYMVNSIHRMTKYINEEKVPINQIYVEFEGAYPNYVLVHYTSYRLRKFEERPTRCNKCQRFGHVHTKCRSNNIVCGKCGGDHNTKDCNIKFKNIYDLNGKVIDEEEKQKLKCSNCGENHPAFSKKCEKFKEAKKVKAVQEKFHISYANALKNIKENNPELKNDHVFLESKKNKMPNDINIPNKVSKTTSTEPIKQSIGTQTENSPLQDLAENNNQSEEADWEFDAEKLIKSLLVPILNFQEGNFIASMLCEILSSVFDKKGKLTSRPKQPIIKAIRKFSSIYEKKNEIKKKTKKSNEIDNTDNIIEDTTLDTPNNLKVTESVKYKEKRNERIRKTNNKICN